MRAWQKRWREIEAFKEWTGVLSVLLSSEGLLYLLAELCYNNILWMLPLQILLVPIFCIVKKKKTDRLARQYIQGFREVLQSLMTSLQAGYSMENACRRLLPELKELYPSEKNPTLFQIKRIVRGMDLHRAPEQLFLEYAEETGVDEIYEFAVVLNIARSTGGNMVEILKNAMERLQGRMDAEEEWKATLSGRVFEKNIMLMMPFGVLFYLRVANPGYVDSIYETVVGNILMTVVILTVLCSYFWTERIMDIRF